MFIIKTQYERLIQSQFWQMGKNVNTKWLQRACATGKVTRQCAVPTELTIPFSFCKKALPEWDICTIALTAEQTQTSVNFPSRQFYSPLHKNSQNGQSYAQKYTFQ